MPTHDCPPDNFISWSDCIWAGKKIFPSLPTWDTLVKEINEENRLLVLFKFNLLSRKELPQAKQLSRRNEFYSLYFDSIEKDMNMHELTDIEGYLKLNKDQIEQDHDYYENFRAKLLASRRIFQKQQP